MDALVSLSQGGKDVWCYSSALGVVSISVGWLPEDVVMKPHVNSHDRSIPVQRLKYYTSMEVEDWKLGWAEYTPATEAFLHERFRKYLWRSTERRSVTHNIERVWTI